MTNTTISKLVSMSSIDEIEETSESNDDDKITEHEKSALLLRKPCVLQSI